jgi:mediator of RNA polymerase II transcription subunit 16
MINWKTEAEKPPPGATPNVTPVMKVSHVAIGNWMDGSAAEVDTYHQQSSMATISHLSIISPCAENVVGPASLPTILTVRSHLPAVTSAFPSAVHSTIDRWELYGCSQSIHPAFEQMGSRKKGGGSQPSVCVTDPYHNITNQFP